MVFTQKKKLLEQEQKKNLFLSFFFMKSRFISSKPTNSQERVNELRDHKGSLTNDEWLIYTEWNPGNRPFWTVYEIIMMFDIIMLIHAL